MADVVVAISFFGGAVVAIGWLVLRQRTSERIFARLVLDEATPDAVRPMGADPQRGWLASWLNRAGFRSPNASGCFVVATVAMVAAGGLVVYAFHTRGTVVGWANLVTSVPGGVGNVFVPVVYGTPWLILFGITAIPLLVVRASRLKRVRSIEQDLPMVLDLLNTLAQAGIGFDAALDRILTAQKPQRPLVQELRIFQYENLAGRSRVESLRRLMRRVDVPAVSTFVSAIIQSEQVGAGIAQTLRTQAEELRARRREKAAAAAMAVPTKLVLPMVIGFLPGIFVVLLGPMLHQAGQVMEQTMRNVTGQ